MDNTNNNTFTKGNIKQAVDYAMARPSSLTFHRACFVVANITGDYTPDQVVDIYRQELAGDVLIEEALRVHLF